MSIIAPCPTCHGLTNAVVAHCPRCNGPLVDVGNSYQELHASSCLILWLGRAGKASEKAREQLGWK